MAVSILSHPEGWLQPNRRASIRQSRRKQKGQEGMTKSTYKEKIRRLLEESYILLEEDADADTYLNFTGDARWEFEVYNVSKREISREEALRLIAARQAKEEADTLREAQERKWLQGYYEGLPD